MSDKTARTHTQLSNRAKPKDSNDKKVVFKSVLDNPYRIRWPSVPINVQNLFLAHLVSALDGISQHHQTRGQENRKRKRAQRVGQHQDGKGPSLKKSKIVADKTEIDLHMDEGEPQNIGSEPATPAAPTSLPGTDTTVEETAMEVSLPEPPVILSHLTFGINAVTKRLESQIQSARRSVTISSAETVGVSASSSSSRPIKIIFVCRADVDPPILIDHLPHLAAAYNSNRPAETVMIVPLPKGAESTLAEAVGLRRVAVIAADLDTPGLSAFNSLLESVPVLSAAWLAPTVPCGLEKQIIPTHIKQVRTSAPKDMKAAKEQRASGRAAAKERKRASQPKT